jgi:hypothetical protein
MIESLWAEGLLLDDSDDREMFATSATLEYDLRAISAHSIIRRL